MIEVLYSGPASLQGTAVLFTREDHHLKEAGLSLLQGVANKRLPKRSQTFQNYILPQLTLTIRPQQQQQQQQPQPPQSGESAEPTIDEHQQQEVVAPKPRPVRPGLGAPRRSYSVTDHEPIPHHHRPSSGVTFMDLPAELHFAVFDFLDPIDSTCLGLTNRHMYAIHRRMRGTVRLSARRDGPNELEWAWHLAARGAAIKAPRLGMSAPKTAEEKERERQRTALSKLRIRGQAYCRKCGVTRCELHKHIQEWMGEEQEYCSVKEKFVGIDVATLEGAKPYCYMSKPNDPKRCGRHRARKTKVVLQ